jgi:hypothetical protein
VRVKIDVDGLSSRQWDHLEISLSGVRDASEDSVRVCVMFGTSDESGLRHAEMSVREFMSLVTGLQKIQSSEQAGRYRRPSFHQIESDNPDDPCLRTVGDADDVLDGYTGRPY